MKSKKEKRLTRAERTEARDYLVDVMGRKNPMPSYREITVEAKKMRSLKKGD